MNNIKVNSSPDATWQKMFQAAKKVQGFHEISDHMEAGGVAAAVLSESGKIYTGVCVDRSEERRVGKECRSRWSPYH